MNNNRSYRGLGALLAAVSLLGACVAVDDPDDRSSSEQLSTGSGSGSAAERCCSVHWSKDQSCTTDSTGLPVLTTINGSPMGGNAGTACSDSYSSTYAGTANGQRCFDTASPPKDANGVAQPWVVGKPYDYKTFTYGRFLMNVPNTVEGGQRCDAAVIGFRSALFQVP